MQGRLAARLLTVSRNQLAWEGQSLSSQQDHKRHCIRTTENMKPTPYDWPCDNWMPTRQIQNLR